MTNLFRGMVLWFTELGWVRRLVTGHRLGHMVADRFVAGDSLDRGMEAAGSLARQGVRVMLDHLGENVDSPAQADEATDAYIRALKRIEEAPDPAPDCNISVKLTQLGLDSSTERCMENMERVLQAASRPSGGSVLVMIDMEARSYVERTLQVYMDLRQRYSNVGVALQCYLFRTAEDARRIAGPSAVVRMVKGAYLEPPHVAYQRRSDVRRSFARLCASLLDAGSTVHFATHDPRLVHGAKRFVRSRGIPKARYEFQMLYGVRRDLQVQLVREAEPVRVYVPYGTSWYPYLTRRLAERPGNAWFFVSNALRRGG